MSRKEAREKAMNLLFQMDVHSDYSFEFLEKSLNYLEFNENQKNYIEEVVTLFLNNKESIDKAIELNAKEWKINRIAKVDLAILRIAVAEIYYLVDIPESVSINEAVELAKTFSTDESGSFINGILGNILKVK